MTIRTHYDALEVARTATPEVIAAAYRSLSKRYHPDLNLGDASAEARMAELNAAYAVLTDEEKRREHDRWIAQVERAARMPPPPSPGRMEEPPRFATPSAALRREALWWMAGGIAIAAAVLVALTVRVEPPSHDPVPERPLPAPAAPVVDPSAATTLPPLQPAPTRPAGYLDAASANDGGGRSRITLDNSGGGVAVEVELLPADPDGAHRRLHLPAGGFFVMERVRGGRYRLGFHDLGDESRTTSAPFQLGGNGKPGDLTFRLAQQ